MAFPHIHSLMALKQLSTAIKMHVNIKDFILWYMVLIISYHSKQRIHYCVMLNLTFFFSNIKKITQRIEVNAWVLDDHEEIRKLYIKALLKIKHHNFHCLILFTICYQSDTEWSVVVQNRLSSFNHCMTRSHEKGPITSGMKSQAENGLF